MINTTDTHAKEIVTTGNRGIHSFDRGIALLVTLALPIPTMILSSVTVGTALAMLFAPLILNNWVSSKFARALSVLAAVAMASGIVTSEFSTSHDEARKISEKFFLYETALLLGVLLTAAVAFWCITKIGTTTFLALWATSLFAITPFISSNFDSNPWKYGWALPASLLIFLSASWIRGPWLLLGVTAVAALSASNGYRSWMLIVGAAVATCVFIGGGKTNKKSGTAIAIGAAALGLVVYFMSQLITRLALTGYLGTIAQQRTSEQEAVAGNLIFGGRPEWPAALELASKEPFGFGLGVSPSAADLTAAIRAMPFVDKGLQDTSTVAISFKSGTFAFHSVFWNFWANYGVGGVLLIVFCALLIGRTVITASRSGLRIWHLLPVLVLLYSGIWDLFFSPLNVSILGPTLGLCLYFESIRKRYRSEFEVLDSKKCEVMTLSSRISGRTC